MKFAGYSVPTMIRFRGVQTVRLNRTLQIEEPHIQKCIASLESEMKKKVSKGQSPDPTFVSNRAPHL